MPMERKRSKERKEKAKEKISKGDEIF